MTDATDPGPMPYSPEDLLKQVRMLQQFEDADFAESALDWANRVTEITGDDEIDETTVRAYLGFALTVWDADHRRLRWEAK